MHRWSIVFYFKASRSGRSLKVKERYSFWKWIKIRKKILKFLGDLVPVKAKKLIFIFKFSKFSFSAGTKFPRNLREFFWFFLNLVQKFILIPKLFSLYYLQNIVLYWVPYTIFYVGFCLSFNHWLIWSIT